MGLPGVHIEAEKEASKRPWVAGFAHLYIPQHDSRSLIRLAITGMMKLLRLPIQYTGDEAIKQQAEA